MSQPSILGLRGRLAGLLEVSRLFHAFGSLRGFRADATDPEARGSNNSEEQSCASSSTQQPLSGRAQPTSLSAHTSDTPAPNNRGPIRAVQVRDPMATFKLVQHLHQAGFHSAWGGQETVSEPTSSLLSSRLFILTKNSIALGPTATEG